ncbi:zincin-like metallopeptidase domain-containing protein [Paenibacillus sp. IITD108]|uniref:zincin-like metallopeptidase domain-containing protein n=1 Tax=Paenibacillus sp. IITD108 TaxID=3116649 RepID=UPI002F3E4EA1
MTKVYEWVADRLIKIIEETDELPWQREWMSRNPAVNWITQKPYKGINRLTTVPGGEYATEYQIKQNGGKIKSEERKNYTMIVYWLWPDKKKSEEEYDEEENESDKERGRPTPLYSKVWDINTQCTGLASRMVTEDLIVHHPIENAEKLIQDFFSHTSSPRFRHMSDTADYVIPLDLVRVPPKEEFYKIEAYYSTSYHEMIHSTGHKTRLARPGIVQFDKFGSEQYGKEELIAEIGASIMCFEAGINYLTEKQNAAYVKNWLKVLKNDKKMIVIAAQQAQRAVDYINSIVQEYNSTKEDVA